MQLALSARSQWMARALTGRMNLHRMAEREYLRSRDASSLCRLTRAVALLRSRQSTVIAQRELESVR